MQMHLQLEFIMVVYASRIADPGGWLGSQPMQRREIARDEGSTDNICPVYGTCCYAYVIYDSHLLAVSMPV